jgi:hypothetical protein
MRHTSAWTRGLLPAGIAIAVVAAPALACTTAVITGKATADGRPLLWKSRDTKSLPRNEVVVYESGKFRVLAVVNDDDRDTVWMGVNSAGFCIENSVSRDLGDSRESKGEDDRDDTAADARSGDADARPDGKAKKKEPGNGRLMKIALETCATVADFKALLERTNESGRRTAGNFGVIDAAGGAALFEAGPRSFRMFDANDPQVAPRGYIVRSNFSTTAQRVPPTPDPDTLRVPYSGERYSRACRLIESRRGVDLDVGFVLRNLCRDMADPKGAPFAGTVNGPAGDPPDTVSTASTLSRTTTVSAGVFHGVKPGEDPLLTTMWVALGDPKFTIAVPCWVAVEELSPAVAGEKGGPICSIASTLREWNLTPDRDGVHTDQLRQVWEDVWPVEDRLVAEVAEMRRRSTSTAGSRADVTALHHRLATLALDAMRDELTDMKEAALSLPAPPPPAFTPSAPALAP